MNYLSFRHYARADWSRSRFYSLSDKTRGLLAGLTNDVQITVFVSPSSDGYQDVLNLLREYQYASARVRVEQVDPHRDIARTEELARQHDVPFANVVVFESAGRTRRVTVEELFETGRESPDPGAAPGGAAFRGEEAFSSAILGLVQGRVPVAYFLEGHGERDPDSADRAEGYSSVAAMVRRDGVEIRKLRLGEAKALPEDADALVIAGPLKRLAQPELDLLRKGIAQNGRMLVLLDAGVETGLESLFEEWGVRFDHDVVVDPARTLTGRELFLTGYGAHPITRGLDGVAAVLYVPRSVMPLDGDRREGRPADRPEVTVLAESSAGGWAESDPDQSPMKFDKDFDRPGPVAVAVAVERGPAPGLDVQIRPMRLVLFGDSDFVANGALAGANSDLFLDALNWLLDRDDLLAVGAKPVDELQLMLTRGQLRRLFWLLVFGLPGAVALWGALVWARRRA